MYEIRFPETGALNTRETIPRTEIPPAVKCQGRMRSRPFHF
jgi:hypothetical protein